MLKYNKKTIILVLYLLAVAAGIYYPVSKIISFEFPSSPPAVFRFAVELYDPYDPFRGRYVQLRVEPQEVTVTEEKDFEDDDMAYAVLERDENGFAVVVDLVRAPEPGKTAIRVEVYRRVFSEGPRTYNYRVSFPFDRFYMNEKLAPEAERVVAEALLQGGKGCVIVANVYANGNATIADLLIGDRPIHDILKEKMAEQKQ